MGTVKTAVEAAVGQKAGPGWTALLLTLLAVAAGCRQRAFHCAVHRSTFMGVWLCPAWQLDSKCSERPRRRMCCSRGLRLGSPAASLPQYLLRQKRVTGPAQVPGGGRHEAVGLGGMADEVGHLWSPAAQTLGP